MPREKLRLIPSVAWRIFLVIGSLGPHLAGCSAPEGPRAGSLDVDTDGNGIPDAVEGGGDAAHDGIPDSADPDNDGDGIPDIVEIAPTTGPSDPAHPIDTDADGVPDYFDTDSDADGLPDSIEADRDIDGDGIPNFRDLDSDGNAV